MCEDIETIVSKLKVLQLELGSRSCRYDLEDKMGDLAICGIKQCIEKRDDLGILKILEITKERSFVRHWNNKHRSTYFDGSIPREIAKMYSDCLAAFGYCVPYRQMIESIVLVKRSL